MKTLQQRVEEALDAGFTVGALAEAAGTSSSAVSQWKSGRTQALKAKTAAGLEALTGWSAGWWATGKGPKVLDKKAPMPGVDQQLSYPAITLPSVTLWEVVMDKEKMPTIPADLMVEMPDGALAPKILKGEHIWFKPASSASPRNVVLIEAAGRRWIRRYAEDADGPIAQAMDDAFPSFSSFTILAVMYMRPQDSI